MKKLGVFAVMMALGTGVAYAASLSIPWYSDNAPAANKVPGINEGVTTLVTLKNNTPDTMTLQIAYYTATGAFIGPVVNSFTIDANSSAAFRPAIDDPDTVAGGQEGTQGRAVPNRPLTGGGNDGKKNGAAVVTWPGSEASAVQGMVTNFQTVKDPARGNYVTVSYAYLLPPGVS